MKWSDIMSEDIMRKGDGLFAKAADLRSSMRASTGTDCVCPPQDQIFRALSITTPDKVKVCIIGQDPYHTPGAANGLAFSINKGRRLQPSLQNIFKELHVDLGVPIPDSGDLTPWAEQGVLLLNTSLTVTAGCPNSHKDWGWQEFTGHVFDLCLDLPQPVVFILWGSNARKFADHVDWSKHPDKLAIMSAHPSPMSADRGFFGSRPFSKTNAFLQERGATPVDWSL